MKIVRTVADLRAEVARARAGGARVGVVPTMGYFHDGHLSLMRRARAECGFVVVTLFVNRLQFNEQGDLARYPRDEARDAALAEDEGVDVLFAPDDAEVYPAGFATSVEVHGLAAPLEGASRGTGHFRGVTTVVAKLFNMVQADVAYFGQKDAQQAMIVRRMVRDLDVPVEIVVAPTVRERDGLAMSSRNALLDPPSRAKAPALYRALQAVEGAVASGERRTEAALERGRQVLADADIVPEYLAAVSPETLAPVDVFDAPTLVALAARVGGVRLIDNVIVVPQEAVRARSS
jgi:pantoate--beta-alanine ligase